MERSFPILIDQIISGMARTVTSSYLDLLNKFSIKFTLRILALFMISTIPVLGSVQDFCDTTVWAMNREDVGVQDVTGRCSEGRISWHSPSGAIRITLEPNRRPNPNNNSTLFEACILASVHAATVKLFLDDSRTTLKPLTVLSPSSPLMEDELCFVSLRGEPVVLYIESDIQVESAGIGWTIVDYENRLVPEPGQRQRDDCRPCTEKEVLAAVCSSDLVFAGTINDVIHNPERGESVLHLKVTRMIRQKRSIFPDLEGQHPSPDDRRRHPGLKVDTGSLILHSIRNDAMTSPSSARIASDQARGVLHAPYRCAIKRGQGEFMFLGQFRFARAYLHCAPRMDQFVDLWRQAKGRNKILCSLE